MTRPSLAGVEKRAAEAAPGPWEEVACVAPDGRRYNSLEGPSGLDVCEVPRTPQGSADAAFIAAARTAVQALTAAVRDVLAAIAHHWDAQVRREAKFGRSGSSCVCEVCDAMRALATHLDLTNPEGDPMSTARQSCVDQGHETGRLLGGLYCWTCHEKEKDR